MVVTASDIHAHAWQEGWAPDPLFTVSQWADEHRMLSQKAAAEPGPWRTSRAPYLREIMDVLSPSHPGERIIFKKPAQIGGTECGNNWIGFVVHHAPGPMLMIQPTVDMVKKVVRQRIDPMIEETPALRDKISEAKARDGSNNLFMKDFAGGMLLLTGANSASALRSMPIKYLFGDELDAWPLDADGEGDPLSLAEKRTTTFRRRKIFLPSTPTIKGLSRIEREWQKSDKRRFFVPCPHCEHFQYLRWREGDEGVYRLIWDRNATGKHLPKTAKYLCESCGVLIEERFKTQMLESGRWQPTAPGDGKTIGFHINALYSPLGWKSWAEIAEEFLESKDTPELLKTWTNTVLAEPWEDRGISVNAELLAARLESWQRLTCPAGVAVLVNAVDVQGDRLECKSIGFGPGEESWLVDYDIIWGAPSSDESVWLALDEWRQRQYLHAGTGKPIRASITLIDSGDETDAVYDFVRPRQAQRVYAIKGKDYLSRPGLAMESTAKNSHIRLFLIGTHASKDRIFSRLRIPAAGAGYMHLPDWIPEQYLDQMTSEKKVITRNPRTGIRKVEYIQNGRNEALDLEVYCLGGLFILQRFINPAMYTDLVRLRALLDESTAPTPSGRKVRSTGVRE